MKRKVFFIIVLFIIFSFSIPTTPAPFGYDNPSIPSLTHELFGDKPPGFYMPLNTSVFGNFSFNGGWENNGLSIIDGDIYARTGFFFNITSLNVTRQNLTILENLISLGNITAPWFIGNQQGNSSIWSRAGTNTFLTNIGDRVGIGTASPKHLLDVGGMQGIGAPSNLGIKSDSGALAIRIEENSGVEGWHIGVDVDGDLNFDDSNTGIRLTFQDETGNVGIGTTNPAKSLEIYSSSPILRIRDSGLTASATTSYIEFGGTNATAVWNRTGYVGDGSSGNADISLVAEVGNLHLGDSSGVSVLTLQGGNVGIGTASPDSKLQIDGNFTSETDSTDSIGTLAIKWLSGFFVNLFVTGNLNVTGNVTAENVFLPTFLFAHTNNTIQVASIGVWYNITFDEEVSSPKFRITHTHNDNTNDTFTIVDNGWYDISYTMVFQDATPTPSAHILGRVVKNGVEIVGSLLEEDSSKQYADFSISNGPIVYLVTGDEIKFQFTADDTDVSLTAHRTYGEHDDTAVIKIRKIGN